MRRCILFGMWFAVCWWKLFDPYLIWFFWYSVSININTANNHVNSQAKSSSFTMLHLVLYVTLIPSSSLQSIYIMEPSHPFDHSMGCQILNSVTNFTVNFKDKAVYIYSHLCCNTNYLHKHARSTHGQCHSFMMSSSDILVLIFSTCTSSANNTLPIPARPLLKLRIGQKQQSSWNKVIPITKDLSSMRCSLGNSMWSIILVFLQQF